MLPLIILLLCSLIAAQETNVDVIIVGAGISGLSAAEKLLKNGIRNIKIIESTDRVGGRMKGFQHNDGFIELGANWIHGTQPDNSLYTFAKENNLLEGALVDRYEEAYLNSKIFSSSGEEISDEIAYDALTFFDQLLSTRYDVYPNITMQQFIDTGMEEYTSENPGATEEQINDWEAVVYALAGFGETEGAEDNDKVPLSSNLEYQDFHDVDNIVLQGGTQSIIDALTDDFPEDIIHLNERVLNMEVTDENVKVTTYKNNFTANHVIVTIPLGVIKSYHKSLFTPNLSEDKVEAIENMGFGALGKYHLEWSDPWWSDDNFMLMAWNKEELKSQKLPEEWFKSVPFVVPFARGTGNILWMSVVGDGARVADSLPDNQIISVATELLRNFTGNDDIPPPDKLHRQTWSSDPNFKGTYSYPGLSSKKEDFYTLLSAVPSETNPRLLLSGEYTHPQYASVLQGARSTGLDQAQKIITFKSLATSGNG